MDRAHPKLALLLRCFPHTRGDGPAEPARVPSDSSFSPHTWGWTDAADLADAVLEVFPTHVGMDRSQSTGTTLHRSFPHTRGDGPLTEVQPITVTTFSPHTWGWTVFSGIYTVGGEVFPTHVGMDRCCLSHRPVPYGFPHTRGDGPLCLVSLALLVGFSPHTWGWTVFGVSTLAENVVFPTHVGMDRATSPISLSPMSFPHTRGDGPQELAYNQRSFGFSPHTWGWTGSAVGSGATCCVFPTTWGWMNKNLKVKIPIYDKHDA